MNITTPKDIFKYQLIPNKNSPKEIYRFWKQDGCIYYEYFDHRGHKYRQKYYSSAESLFEIVKSWTISSDISSVHNPVAAKIQELSKRFEQRPKKQEKVKASNHAPTLREYATTVAPTYVVVPDFATYDEMVTYVTGRW